MYLIPEPMLFFIHWGACVLVTKSCLSICHPVMDCSPPDPLSMGFSRQKYWSGLPFPPPGDLPNPGIKPISPSSPALQADSLPLSHRWSPATTHSWSDKWSWNRCLDISQGVVGRGTCHPAYTKWVGGHSGPPTFHLTHIWGRYRSLCSAS